MTNLYPFMPDKKSVRIVVLGVQVSQIHVGGCAVITSGAARCVSQAGGDATRFQFGNRFKLQFKQQYFTIIQDNFFTPVYPAYSPSLSSFQNATPDVNPSNSLS
jgi:hypothetical protein